MPSPFQMSFPGAALVPLLYVKLSHNSSKNAIDFLIKLKKKRGVYGAYPGEQAPDQERKPLSALYSMQGSLPQLSDSSLL